jgi:hypothetical protein
MATFGTNLARIPNIFTSKVTVLFKQEQLILSDHGVTVTFDQVGERVQVSRQKWASPKMRERQRGRERGRGRSFLTETSGFLQ